MVGAPKAREWGPWSVWKTEIVLGAYLPLFLRAAKSSLHRVFIDFFSGTTRNFDRTGQEIRASPWVALQATDGAGTRFTHLLFFELAPQALALERSLRQAYPNRRFHVVPGDCNLKAIEGLAWLKSEGTPRSGPHLGATLAYLDPDGLELRWSTVETVARWCTTAPAGEYTRRNRVELLILFPTGPLRRTLPQRGKKAASETQRLQVDTLFGNDEWRVIYQAQREGRVVGEGSWLHYVDLYRLGLKRLGYRYTSAIEVRNTKRVVLYHLVFATSNRAGRDIMSAVQQRARQILPRMIAAEQRRRAKGEQSMFDEEDEELIQIAADPASWASFFNYDPVPFNREQHSPPAEQTTLFDMIEVEDPTR
jgi:three-Cys-motif partner protein